MNLKELKRKHPAKHAEWELANAEVEAAKAERLPHNQECGRLWTEVEKAEAAYQKKREETAALERRLRLEEKSRRVAALAREIKGM